MADNFTIAHKFTAKWEGGESDHPDDGGGLTKYGVSLKFLGGLSGTQSNRDVLERMGIRLPITRQVIYDLTRDQAASLFRWQFWDKLRLSLIPLRPAVVLYDAAVNSGPAQSVKLAQRGYNACVTYGQPLVVDGIMGPALVPPCSLPTRTNAFPPCSMRAKNSSRQSWTTSPASRFFCAAGSTAWTICGATCGGCDAMAGRSRHSLHGVSACQWLHDLAAVERW